MHICLYPYKFIGDIYLVNLSTLCTYLYTYIYNSILYAKRYTGFICGIIIYISVFTYRAINLRICIVLSPLVIIFLIEVLQ